MYLSEIKLWNFRKFGIKGDTDFEQSEPGLTVHFHKGVNVIIGKNDSGKTAIMDAIRYVLHTKSGEYIPIDEKDFHKPEDGARTTQMKIQCLFRDLSADDAGLFLEFLSLEDEEHGKKAQILRVTFSARRLENGKIIVRTYAGESGESNTLLYEAREYLTVVYLKPLRDALQDMTHGYKSRLAQILQAHPIFGKQGQDNNGKHELENSYNKLKNSVDEYFSNDDEDGRKITNAINEIIKDHFLLANDDKNAVIRLTGSELPDILRQLDLILEDNKSGLGSLNLLCMAAELLLFMEQSRGLKLTLIEELEAHIHPQLQLRLIDYFEEEQNFGQFILTTHSITLGATIPLEKLIVMTNDEALSMDAESTMCSEQDYKFLHRFLDATKANLFFAKGLILVEGDAENLLIPAIAKIIGKDLHEYGVSIVNVGSTAYKRYVKIFQRRNNEDFGMPISIVSDLDVRSLEYYEDQKEPREYKTREEIEAERVQKRNALEAQYSGEIRIFLSKCWTLEYDIAKSALYKKLATAIELAKVEMRGDDTNIELSNKIKRETDEKYTNGTNDEVAYKIFKPLNNGSVSKAITAQYLAELLSSEDKETIEADEYLGYIVRAIKHVTSE